MQRCVEPELLDELPAQDPRAIHSRSDLVRLNSLMGNPRIMARTLLEQLEGRPPHQIVELGAGDGMFMLKVARQVASRCPGVSLKLLDRHDSVQSQTIESLHDLGWKTTFVPADILEVLETGSLFPCDAMLANLFLHHFTEPQLAVLFRWAQRCTDLFIALEPARSRHSLAFSKLVGFVGCRAVTRHDAPVSVRAGFTHNELSHLWPADGHTNLRETSVGWFGHLFVAKRIVPVHSRPKPCPP